MTDAHFRSCPNMVPGAQLSGSLASFRVVPDDTARELDATMSLPQHWHGDRTSSGSVGVSVVAGDEMPSS